MAAVPAALFKVFGKALSSRGASALKRGLVATATDKLKAIGDSALVKQALDSDRFRHAMGAFSHATTDSGPEAAVAVAVAAAAVTRGDGLAREAMMLLLAWALAAGRVLSRHASEDPADAAVMLLMPTYMLFYSQVLACAFLFMYQERAQWTWRGVPAGAVDGLFAFMTRDDLYRAFLIKCGVIWGLGSALAGGVAFWMKRVRRERSRERVRDAVAWFSVALLAVVAAVFAVYAMVTSDGVEA